MVSSSTNGSRVVYLAGELGELEFNSSARELISGGAGAPLAVMGEYGYALVDQASNGDLTISLWDVAVGPDGSVGSGTGEEINYVTLTNF
jgi:hypothetical protein